MNFLNFFLYFGFVNQDVNFQNISFSENIEYCTNIIHNPNLENEFNKVCDLDETNKYIMLVKSDFRN